MEECRDDIKSKLYYMDEILHKISSMSQAENEKQLDDMTPSILKSVGKYTAADRAYIFEWNSEKKESFKNTFEWCASGIEPQIQNLQEVPVCLMQNWVETFIQKKNIIIYDLEEIAEETPQEYEILKPQNIHSLIAVPIYTNHKFIGFIGLDNPDLNQDMVSMNLLSDVGCHMGSVRENLRMMKVLEQEHNNLEKSLEELQKEKNILDVLSIDYTAVYYCDLMKDLILPVKQEHGMNTVITEQQSFSFRIRYYFEHFVIRESAPDFMEKLSLDHLVEYLGHHERFTYCFRCRPNPTGQKYFEVQIVRLKNIPGFKAVMGYRYIDGIIEEQERQKAELEDALETANLNGEIIDSISKLYWLIYRMNLETGTYEEISAGNEMHKLTGRHGKTEEAFQHAINTIVDGEHQEMMKEFLDTSTLADRLKDTESIAVEYRAQSGSWHLARFIEKKRNPSGKVTNVLYVVRQIDEEKQVEIAYKQELMKKNRLLSGLSRDYTTAFVLNLDTDEYEFVFNQATNHAQKREEFRKFSDYVDAYASAFVLPEFQDVMRRELDSNVIKKHFETEDEYHFSFETSPNVAGLSCFQAHIVKEYEEDSHFAFLGFRSIDEIVQKERFYKDSLQKVNQALKHQLDMITSALPGGVKISNDDPEYSFKYVSEHFAQMLGYDTPEELMEASGGTIADLAHPDDLEQGIAQALEQYGKADHYEITYRMKCKNGSWKYIEDRGHKIRKSDGMIEHWNLILDKNELVEKTIALESEKKANQSKSDFLSRMSHDMRTPLNGIIGLMDICMKHPEDRTLVDSSRLKARVAADHLLSLINDTLELSKLENEEVKLAKEDFYLPELLCEVETIAQMRADEECITIHFMYDPYSIPYPNLIGSALHVKQIFLNLITNSIKYNRKNGSVDCCLKEEKESDERVLVDVTIKDTGIGMSEDFLKNIFQPFVQADQGARSQYKGTGLGMAIVKELIDRMGGTIQIDSVENQGTSIHVVIPFEIAEEPVVVKERFESPKEKLSGRRILLAEDNELNREIAVFLLKDEGISVTEAEDGQQALECFLKMPEGYYDAVLMDIMMPAMDGYQAARAIRGSGKKDAETIPIIAMTANAFAEDKRKTMEAGMDAHLSKPLNVPELMETIRKFCVGKQMCQ
ncbi:MULTISPECIES: ATP-binding protein [Blautia]|uniref:ATP-binding protein n=1 Tax=Blautia TaxID=572511 RepID=UPI00156E5462|nr:MULTISPECIES: ATP-binding protein [Blautia]MCB5473353.1 response regulator [Blautia luti]NSK76679.1 response regulator [Blautia massiliensis (ex Durand et al. 2017)]